MADQTKKNTPRSTTKTPARTPTARGAVTKCRTKVMPTEEQIRLRAYEIYLRRGNAPGTPESDWAQAERELIEELNS